ncbi:MAG: META domain-containing protein [Methylobacter sp.]
MNNANITGIVWKLRRFEGASKLHNFVIDDPNKYSLILLPNGSYQVNADCNRMQGQYALERKRLKIAPGAATSSECPPGSWFAAYLRYLTEAATFTLHDNKLQLNLMMDGDCLIFENGGEISDSRRH